LRKIGIDIDGVICIIPNIFRKFLRYRFFRELVRYLIVIPQFRQFYDYYLREVNVEIKRFISYLQENGWEIHIISANYEGYRRELEKWLKRNKIYYDKMFLYSSSTHKNAKDWKAYICKKLNVDYFVDDVSAFVRAVEKKTKTKTILYRRQKFEELIKMIK